MRAKKVCVVFGFYLFAYLFAVYTENKKEQAKMARANATFVKLRLAKYDW